MVKPDLTYYLWRFAANGASTARRLMNPTPCRETHALAHELQEHGIVVGPSDRFLSDQGRDALAAAAAAIRTASQGAAVREILAGAMPATGKKSFRIDLIRGAIRAENPILKVALDRTLLDGVAAYLGMWPALHSIGAWLNYPTAEPATSSQLWHHDPEDLKIIKVFIYLEDVGLDNGPFTYLPGTQPFGPQAALAARYDNDRLVQDEAMTQTFPSSSWRICTGPAGTMILADTVGFHRGGKPTRGTRLLVTFTYTSGTPLFAHSVRIKGEPAWASSALQKWAIRQLQITPARPDGRSRQHPSKPVEPSARATKE
jgi:hypothetical protein